MFSKIKRAFGFGQEDDELIADDPDVTSQTSPRVANYTADTKRNDTTEARRTLENKRRNTNTTPADTEPVKNMLFEHVVAQFNKALPDFLAKSVDPERQKEYLLKAMSDDLKAHLEAVEQDVSSRIDQSWQAEREKLKNDLKQVSDTAKDLETKRAELKQQQLSNERQRRALTERVHDLEKRILTLEAEKEQLELETKSLLNKVKVSQVHEKEADELREQVEQLQSELIKKRTESAEDTPTSQITDEVLISPDEVDRLRKVEKDYETLTAQLGEIDDKMAQVEELTERKDARIASLGEEVAKLTEQRDQAVADAQKARAEAEAAIKDAEATRQAAEQARKEAEEALKAAEAASNTEQASKTTVSIAADDEVNLSHPDKPRKPVDLDADNDLLNDTDWIVNPKQRSTKRNENKQRQKRTPRDDGQMSLW